ncbi:ADP-ribosylglycohydrolase [Micromonospora coriariae]|uniref:ADP-ribosylglycohydrolase n=1 Tax=Micromonospora coriariae TaxID=285665 RepID=A0A1C4U283_9ACTN|nr:ADP-ribosylglycohydrolase family protein [Micromonospora coriariae]SCE65801.1 ADP-ribosylglycohydrolase [Micromonospora coriariae]
MTDFPDDYEERVYAGVLGKVIAVYLGRPFEGWRFERIQAELGDITGYVNHRTDLALKNHLLVVTDDDISGTFMFPRALRDHGTEPTSAQIGQTWLNEIAEGQSVLWWGGVGNSTEHTAYLHLKDGVLAPDSGSIARNGVVVAEQVGAQIFVEGFAMTRPGDPEAAADLAERAARVSHDGESIHAARVVAALVAGAFTETDMERLLDTAVALIPKDSLIHRVIADVREWTAADADWKTTRARIDARYGYESYGGNCHVVPNHATVIHAVARSGGAFLPAMTVVNTSGWDTDSNAGDVGAICGVFGGLAGIDGAEPDYRGPVADRMYLPSTDGGSTITDVAREALTLARHGRAWARQPERDLTKNGARFHFSLPGSVQGFTVLSGAARVHNPGGRLAVEPTTPAITVATPTFIPAEARAMPIYGLIASPTLYSGQTIHARLRAGTGVEVRPVVGHYADDGDALNWVEGPAAAGDEIRWTVPDLGGQPITYVGLRATGAVEVESLTWDGTPTLTLTRPATAGTGHGTPGDAMWRRAWVKTVDRWDPHWPEPFRIVQNRGTGLLIQGERGWRDYTVHADVTPHLAEATGLAVRVQGLTRYYALRLAGRDRVELVRHDTVLASRDFPWEYGATYRLAIRAAGTRLTASVDDEVLFDLDDDELTCGGVALLVTQGRTATQSVRITPISVEETS